MALYEEIGDDLIVSRLLNDLGTLDQARGDLNAAIEYYRASLQRLPLGEGETGNAAMVRNNLGLALVSLGERPAGLAELEQARAIYAAGVPAGRGAGTDQPGPAVRLAGRSGRRTGSLPGSVDDSAPFRETRMVAEVLNSLGVLARNQGQFEQAIDYYTQSLALAQEAHDLGGQAQALGNLGATYHQQGRTDRARPCYREALAHHEALGDLRGQALMWGNLGQLDGLDNRSEDALAAHRRSLNLYHRAGAELDAGIAQVNLAGVLRMLDRQDEAEALYLSAIETGRRLDDLRLQDRALGGLGILCSMQGRFDEARALLSEALTLQRRRGTFPPRSKPSTSSA
ncbi:MAG: tetratricopeptide repeat protein [Anaerolineae bacterium]|nr:MAG: tetratricopeptide repeat protein [Anaerolineae bacterium]